MEDEIICPRCHKKNGRYNFCMYCGEKLPIDLNTKVQDSYCLNCGRPVKEGQENCECGYEFADITCPECNEKNAYTNRFCMYCGEKLWQYKAYYYIYSRRIFGHHLINWVLPDELKNTAVYKRYKNGMGKDPLNYIKNTMSISDYESEISKAESNIKEIRSRWKVVSPYCCIDCLNIIDPDEYTCPHCGYSCLEDKKRVECLKSENKYVEPLFEYTKTRWTSKGTKQYLKSLAPAIGESQFEYRERLKWEFSENLVIIDCLKSRIADAIEREKEEKERKKREEEYERQAAERRRREEEFIRQYGGGGYCRSNCRYHEEEILTSHGISGDYTEDMIGVEYYCRLGHSVSHGRLCKDYKY